MVFVHCNLSNCNLSNLMNGSNFSLCHTRINRDKEKLRNYETKVLNLQATKRTRTGRQKEQNASNLNTALNTNH